MRKTLAPRWYLNLRWFALMGQLLLVGISYAWLELTLPWVELIILLSLIPATNLLAKTSFAEARLSTTVGSLLVLDTLILTGLLYLTGGATNPFSIAYLLHVVLAAVLLGPLWTWIITFLSSAGFALLFQFSIAVPEWMHHEAGHGMSSHLRGMLVAYLTVAFLSAYFLNRILTELQRKNERLHKLELLSLNQQRLASLTALTANAAHELGTPLGTIAVVAHEMELQLRKSQANKYCLEDILLLKQETDRCKAIIHNLSEGAGELLGEPLSDFTLGQLIEQSVSTLKIDPSRIKLKIDQSLMLRQLPPIALAHSLRSLIKNALEANEGCSQAVEVYSSEERGLLCLCVKDCGPGIKPEDLNRVGEPFFSTKGFGKGMGLGVYLAKLTVEQIGGKIQFESTPANGTTVKLYVPLNYILSEAA